MGTYKRVFNPTVGAYDYVPDPAGTYRWIANGAYWVGPTGQADHSTPGPNEGGSFAGPGSTQTPPTTPDQPTTPTTPTTPPPTTVDPNVPLSTPTTPVNQSTVPSTDISPFIPATSTQQQDIINQAINQSRGVGQQNLADLTDLFHKNIIAQVSNWTDPNSPDYQQTMGQLNNVGRADPNTFGQSLASRLAPLISTSLTEAGNSALQPSFAAQQGLVGQGANTQSDLGLAGLNRFIQQQNFQQQAQLANQLADKGQPSNFQQTAGGVGGILGGLGGLGQGLGSILGGKSTWLCTKLKQLGLATPEEVNALHDHLKPSMYRHPVYWLHYLYTAPRLIALADAAALDWSTVKPLLIDRVLEEKDPEGAWEVYRSECERLCGLYAPELWVFPKEAISL